MTYSSEVLADAPVMFLRFGEPSGTALADSSGNGHGATLEGAGTLGVAGLTSESNTALALPGTSSLVVSSDAGTSWINSDAFTAEGIFIISSFTSFPLLMAHDNDGVAAYYRWRVYVDPTGSLLKTSLQTSGGSYVSFSSGVALTVGTKYHIALTYAASSWQLWVNGSPAGSAYSATAIGSRSGPLRVGGLRGSHTSGLYSNLLTGTVDEFAFYNTALSSGRIAAHYAAIAGGGGSPTVVSGGQGVETDAGQAGATKVGTTRSGGQGTETDAPQAGTVSTGQVAPGGQGAETDTPQAGTVKAGTVRAGGQAVETDAPAGGSVSAPSGDMVAVDLSTFTNLYGTTTWSGTALVGSPAYFSFASLVVDPATTYTVEIDYTATGGAGYISIHSATGANQASVDVSTFETLGESTGLAGTGTTTLTIGPGLMGWDAGVVAAGERYVPFQTSGVNITGIRVSPAMDGAVTPPDPPVITRRPTSGRSRGGRATVVWEPPVVQPPITVAAATLPRRIGAVAISDVVMAGAVPVFTENTATKTRTRHRILVGGKDVSFYRGVETPEPGYELAEPLLWGPATLTFPQIVAAFENPGKGELRWCRKGAPVVLQRVTATGEIVAVDYRGVVIAHDTNGANLVLQVGGHAQGRAALRHKPLPIFKDTLDLGRLGWAAIRDLGLRFEPRMGPTTGIRSALFGGMDHLTYIAELCAKAWQRDGTQWTIMPSDAGVYRMKRKDTDTIDFTVFLDDERAVGSLRSDAAEEHNRVFATGTTPKGQRVRFGVYPELKPGPPAPYPFTDGRNFDVGTSDADTDTGDGVFVMIRKLWAAGYLSLEDADGVYDQQVAKAVAAVQEESGLTGPVGVMTEQLWKALFDVETGGYTLRGSRIEPAAQAPRVRRYFRSASGTVIGKNPSFDPTALVVDRIVDFGAGFTRHQMREWSRAEIARGEDNWVGTIEIKTGAVFHGDVAPGATVDGDSLMDVRAIKPGMNARLPLFAGGVVVHVSAVKIAYDGEVPLATLTVDTQARDALPVWEIIRRNRETRRDPARRWHGGRASTEVKDSITEWDEVGGVLYGDRELVAGWNVFPVVAGQEGSVSRLRLRVFDTDGDGVEFACALFGKKITPARLNHLVARPLANSVIPDPETDEDDEDEPTPPPLIGDRAWERRSVKKVLRKKWHLYSAGTYQEPCGYSPGRKTWVTTTSQSSNPDYDPTADKNSTGTDDDEYVSVSTTTAHGKLTGVHNDDAGFSYRTDKQPVVYLAVFVRVSARLEGGRVMWAQLEAGA